MRCPAASRDRFYPLPSGQKEHLLSPDQRIEGIALSPDHRPAGIASIACPSGQKADSSDHCFRLPSGQEGSLLWGFYRLPAQRLHRCRSWPRALALGPSAGERYSAKGDLRLGKSVSAALRSSA